MPTAALVPVARHTLADVTAILHDVAAMLGHGAPHVFQEPWPIPGLDRDPDAKRCLGIVTTPRYLGEALGRTRELA